MAIDKKQVWLDFARDAVKQYEIPDSVEDVDELTNDMVDVATGYADLMLEEFEDRVADGVFGGSRSTGERASRRRRRDEPEEPGESGEREDD